MIILTGKYSTANIMADSGEESAIAQIIQMLNSPAITNPVRIMPDFHGGKGSVIGTTYKSNGLVIPGVVGVDINCGMLSFEVTNPNYNTEQINALIRSVVPLNMSICEKKIRSLYQEELELAKLVGMDVDRAERSIGTLGGGNHFIEAGTTDTGSIWFTIHTGSRNFGLKVAEYYQRKAVEYSGKEPGVAKGMEFLPEAEYLEAMKIVSQYAIDNRVEIMFKILEVLDVMEKSFISCNHNFISEDGMIRKGATSAKLGEKIILPFNRKDGILIMEGLGNKDWNESAPHGAGRKMSRGEAGRTLDPELVKLEMEEAGVYSTNDPLDEAPAAYKSPDEIMTYMGETARLLFKIKPFLNIKG